MQTFNLEYVVSIAIAMFCAWLVHSGSPTISPFITFFVIPLLVAYLAIQFINFTFPRINQFGSEADFYIKQKTYSTLNSMNYIQIFPPLMAVLILFFIMLYNRNLS